ncbi:lecithin retinol acyltransferase-like isoform X2 [Macrotis lagotis]|uniref:lecithin retinol acyltransferase-like isoform X2 n=1 Tax=Macrotis lagotis TaxID=92651 RepID=UPI003D69708A
MDDESAEETEKLEPKPGDLLEIFRTNYSYWAIYVGHGCVVHLEPPHQHLGVGTKKSAWKKSALVKMERLSVVAGNDKYQVNNKHDDIYQPLPPYTIVQRAFKEVGNEVFYKLIQEYFLTYLRYGIPGSNQQEPKPGDLIEIFRRGYSHWAVYVGYGCVVHLAPPLIAEIAPLKREVLYVMVGSNRFQVNNKYDDSDPPLPPNQIVHRALKLVGKLVPYNLLNNNCEHFATRLRSGVPRCDQIRNALQKLPGLAVNLMELMQ